MAELQSRRWQGKSGGWAGDTFVAAVWTFIGGVNAWQLWRGFGHMPFNKELFCGMLAFLSPILVAQKVSLLLDRWKAKHA